jgi:tetratricopeptide (TPR) repeat protein
MLFLLLSINLFALEISIDSAKDNFSKYSTLHLWDSKEFICEEVKNDFEVTTEIICAFSKKPSQSIGTIKNDFFKVNTILKDNMFFLSIKPLHKIKLLSEVFDLTQDNSVYTVKASISKRWLVIGYKEKLPLIYKDEHSSIGINFPFYLERDKLPFVGSLDIKGNPVHIKRVGDVKEYIKIKKYYEEKQYERSIDVIEEILRDYPRTLFKAELIYYKIKVYSQLKDYDNVVSNAKVYLREYSANENVPEVLALAAKAYSNIGLVSDAEYFFDRLFSEHKGSIASQWGYIYRGEMLEASGGASKAMQFYKKALRETSNIDVATTAAYRIASATQGIKSAESAKYIEKILNAKPSFFIEHIKSANKMMYSFADEEHYKTAASMGQAIINEIDPTYDEYETYLKDIALWLAKTDDKQKALVAINKYIKQFPDGDYINEVDIVKDALFFDTPDLNNTARLAEYENLIDTYKYDTIGNRAIYERGKLLLELGEFSQIIETKDELLQLDAEVYPEKEKIVTSAAIGLMKKSLENKKCEEVLVISNDYNITLSNKWDDGIYECAMKGGDYQLAKRMTLKNLKSLDIELRKKWLYRYVKVDFSIGNYSNVIAAANDLITLISDDTNSQYKDVYRYLFDTYKRLEQNEKLIGLINEIEKVFGVTYKDIERYVTMISLGSEKKDDNMVIKYAKKVMDIQNSSSSSAQSPYVEFTLYQSYVNVENYNAALDVIESLDNIELKKIYRARQKYLLGSILIKLWRDDEAQIAYKEAISADPDSPWAKLAKSALNL